MKKSIIVGLALSAVVAATGKANAYMNYPWCIIGDTRGIDCVFMTREQCSLDGRNRGFGGQCINNPFYNPALPPVAAQGFPPNSASSVTRQEGPRHSRRKSHRH
jgi:hypothetical protein